MGQFTRDRAGRMRSGLVVVLAVLSLVVEGARVRREACTGVQQTESRTNFEDCTKKAYTEYTVAITAGDDGKKDWFSRKSCNYLTAAVDTCGDELLTCLPQDMVNVQKDAQVKSIITQLESQVNTWDSNKCPVVVAYKQRLAAAQAPQTAAQSEANPAPEPETEPNSEPEGDPESSAEAEPQAEGTDEPDSSSSSLAASISILLICFALF